MARDFTRTNGHHLNVTTTPITAPAFTLVCWFNLDDVANSQDLISLGDTDTQRAFRLNAGGNAGGDPVRAIARDEGSFGIAVSSTGFSTGTWHHAAATFTTTTARAAFIDGGSKGTNTSLIVVPSIDRIRIGESADSDGGNNADGRIAEAAIYNEVLDDAEIAILALGYSPLFVRRKALVAYWQIIGNLSPEPDYVGNFDLTLAGDTGTPVKAAHTRIIPRSRQILQFPPVAAGGASAVLGLTLLGVGT